MFLILPLALAAHGSPFLRVIFCVVQLIQFGNSIFLSFDISYVGAMLLRLLSLLP